MQIVRGRKSIQRDRCARRTRQLFRCTVWLHIEMISEIVDARHDLVIAYPFSQRAQFVHFEMLDVAAERDRDLRDVRLDVEHPAVIVAQQPHAVVGQRFLDARGRDPLVDLGPDRFVSQYAGHLVKCDARARKNIGDLRHRTRRTIRQPLAGHRGPVRQTIERVVVDRRSRLQVQHQHRNAGPLHHRQHGCRERISRHVDDQQIHVGPAARVSGLAPALRRIHQAQLLDRGAGLLQPRAHLAHVAFQPRAQPVKLRPVRIQPDAAQAHA